MSKTGTVHITSRAPGSNHEGGVHALFEGFKHDISLSQLAGVHCQLKCDCQVSQNSYNVMNT